VIKQGGKAAESVTEKNLMSTWHVLAWSCSKQYSVCMCGMRK
jgi:hypothetical protein